MLLWRCVQALRTTLMVLAAVVMLMAAVLIFDSAWLTTLVWYLKRTGRM